MVEKRVSLELLSLVQMFLTLLRMLETNIMSDFTDFKRSFIRMN